MFVIIVGVLMETSYYSSNLVRPDVCYYCGVLMETSYYSSNLVRLDVCYYCWGINAEVDLELKKRVQNQGRIQDLKLGGAHLKKLRRAEGGANNFTPKNHIFSNFRGGGGMRRMRAPPDPPLLLYIITHSYIKNQ